MILNKLVRKMIGIFAGVSLVTAGVTPFTPSAFASTSAPPVVLLGGQQWVLISTAAQLEYIDQNQTSDITSGSTTTYLNAHIMLMNSIDLSGYAWIPIGASSGSIGSGNSGNPLGSLIPGPFSGTFNGNGYEVTNVSVSIIPYYDGFFGYSSGTVENMGVEGTILTNDPFNVGVLVGKDVGSITNCYTTGYISSTQTGNEGGLVGVQAGGSITDSYSTVNVDAGGSFQFAVGGLVGRLASATVSNSYSLGQVLNSGYIYDHVGGLIGENLGTVSDSYYDEGTSNQSGGIGAQSDYAMKQQSSTYTNWNFKNTWWGLGGYYPYPSLKSQKYKTNFPVFYNSNGGPTVSDEIVGYRQVAIQPTQPTMTGSTFGGWYSDSGLTTPFDFSTPITSVTTLYAKWTCTVNFDSNGGTIVSSETVGYGTDATQPIDPTKTGYVFKGWYSDSQLTTPFGFSTAIKGNATLYAKWVLPASDAPPVVNGWVQVSTPIQLEYIDQNQNSDITTGSNTTYLSANIELMNNIDLSGYSLWTPIGGNSFNPYSGTFNGQGYEIQGLAINDTVDSDVGFFGASLGTVENLMVNGNLNGSSGNNGGLMGEQLGGIITDANFTGSVAGGNGANGGNGGNGGLRGGSGGTGGSGGSAGGLVGSQSGGNITDSYFTGSVNSGAGGNGGTGGNGNTMVILGSSYSGSGGDGGNGGSGGSAGGLVGNQSGGSIADSYSSGRVTGGASGYGGNGGTATGFGSWDGSSGVFGSTGVAGGLVGSQNGGSVSDSFFDFGTTSQSYGVGTNQSASGVTGESDSSMRTGLPFVNAGWDFSNIWNITSNINNGYPNLIRPAVVLANGSMGTVVGKEITGLNLGDEYAVLVGTGSSAITEYVMADGTLSTSSSDAASLTSKSITGLTTGTTYNVQLQLSAPTWLTTNGTSSTQTTLSWNAVTGATSYDVYEEGSLIATGVTGTSYTVNDLTPGDLYRFTISAVNAIGGESAQSNAVSVNMEKFGSVDLTSSSADVLSGSPVTVSGVVYDVYHSPVSYAIVNFSSPTGLWSTGGSSGKTVTTDVYGAFTATWTAPSVTSETNTTVTASVVGTVYGAVSNVTSTTLSLNVAPPPTISTTTLSGGTAGDSYSQTLDLAGGFAPYSWTVSPNSLPNGLTLNSSTGVISGTPTVTGTFDFTVQVKDTAGNTATQALSITVNKPSSPSGSGGASNNGGTTTPSNNGGTSTPPNNSDFSSAWQRTVNVTSGTSTTVNVQGSDVSVQSVGTPISGNAVEITTQTLDTIPQITTNLPVTANVTSALGLHYTGTGFSVKVTIFNPSIQIGSAVDEWVNGQLLQVPATVVNGQVSLQISSNTDLVVVTPKPMVLYPNVREMVWNGQTYGYQSMVKKDPNTGKNTTYMPIWYVMQVLNQAGIHSTWNGHTWSMSSSNPSVVTLSSGNTLSQRGDMTITLNGQLSEQIPGIVGEDMIHGNKTTFMPIWYVMQILKQAGVHSDWTGSMWALYPTDPPTTQQ